MAALIVSDLCGDEPVLKVGPANQLIAVRAEVDVDDTLADDDVLKMIPLPPNCVLNELILDSDDLDSDVSPAIVVDAGILEADDSAVLAAGKIISSATICQSGGIYRADENVLARIAPSLSTRFLGIEVKTTAATAASSGTVGLTAIYRLLPPRVYESDLVKPWWPKVSSSIAGGLIALRGSVTVYPNLKATDVLKLVKIPPGMTLVDLFLDADDLDSGGSAALTMNVGILKTNGLEVDSSYILVAATTAGQAAGLVRGSKALIQRVAADPSQYRTIGAYVLTTPTIGATGTIGLTVLLRT